MADNIYSQTKEMFESIFDIPKMQISKLQKPSFKYIFDIFAETLQ